MKLIPSIKSIFTNIRRLLSLAWKMDKKVTSLYYLTALISALIPFASSYVLKLLIDNLQIEQATALNYIPVIIVVILAARYLITFLQSVVYWGFNESYLDYIFRYKLQNEITLNYHRKIASLDIAYFENPEIQNLMSKTRETMQWEIPESLRYLSYLLNDVVAFITAFIVLIPYGWLIPIAVSAIAIPRLYLQAKYGAIQWSIWGGGAPQAKKLWYLDYILQEPTTVRETRISQSSENLLNKFKSIQISLFNISKSGLDKYLRVLTIPPIIEALVIFIMAYMFLPSVIVGVISLGSFTLIINMLEQLGSTATNASSHFARIYKNNLYVNHYFEFLNLKKLMPVSSHPVKISDTKPPKIEFKNVSFNYPKGVNVLNNVSFTIEPGESVAFVGHNGAGKTTIVKLICRFYDVNEGEILINGINIKELDLPTWYGYLGTLFQEFVRYHFTVRENICIGAPGKDNDEEMFEAAKKAGASDFIEKLPLKYEQVLGKEFEDGIEISGGQWQKLAIARAFYEEPPILILDEPTSAIDAEAEYEIFNNLEIQYKLKTLILVSHRFSTVRNANKIIVIEKGQVVETGTHGELMDKDGLYAKLFHIQAKGYQ